MKEADSQQKATGHFRRYGALTACSMNAVFRELPRFLQVAANDTKKPCSAQGRKKVFAAGSPRQQQPSFVCFAHLGHAITQRSDKRRTECHKQLEFLRVALRSLGEITTKPECAPDQVGRLGISESLLRY
jgi:hypothetical protein